jgi:hypothetical protein
MQRPRLSQPEIIIIASCDSRSLKNPNSEIRRCAIANANLLRIIKRRGKIQRVLHVTFNQHK